MLYSRVCSRCNTSKLTNSFHEFEHGKWKKICILCEIDLKTLIALIKNKPQAIITKRGVQTTIPMYFPPTRPRNTSE